MPFFNETMNLLQWYDQKKRELPWRRSHDPYNVWISEIMLQQTRVESVIPYYETFLARFPKVQVLADADIEAVYKAWEGLGYYARARHLHEAAGIITARGVFPSSYEEWRKLPGVGEYTAGAVASICLNEPVCAVDGNVLRVIARVAGIRDSIDRPSVKRVIYKVAEQLLDRIRPGDFNQALMELGAVVCTPRALNCETCPLRQFCDAFAVGDAHILPLRSPKQTKKTERLDVAVIFMGDLVLLHRRALSGLLAGQWEFPHGMEKSTLLTLGAIKQHDLLPRRHVFTHCIWEMKAAVYHASHSIDLNPDYRWVTRSELISLPIPSAMAMWREIALERMMH